MIITQTDKAVIIASITTFLTFLGECQTRFNLAALLELSGGGGCLWLCKSTMGPAFASIAQRDFRRDCIDYLYPTGLVVFSTGCTSFLFKFG